MQGSPHRCRVCREVLTDDYLEHYPFPEVPCPCCGSLVPVSDPLQHGQFSRDKRKEERCEASLKVTYRSFNRFMVDYTRNVSRGGMFVRTASFYPPGTKLDLLLHVPGLAEPIRIMGRVAHAGGLSAGGEDAGIGIEFIDIDEKSRDLLVKRLAEMTHAAG
ncbi:MAG: hypothetical protein OHK006_24350 [Thermodesulfovibrionales bacterium]